MRVSKLLSSSLRLKHHNKLSTKMNALSFDCSKLPEKFIESSHETQCKIIHMGTSLYYNGNKWVYEDLHQKKLSESNVKFEALQQNHENNLQLLKNAYAEKLTQHSSLIEEKYAESMHSKDLLLKTYFEELAILKERCKTLEAQNVQALSIGNKLDSLIGKKSTVDNIAKGNFGESVVWNQITHYYPSSILDDCSDETGAGDMLWTLQSFNALVEVKNVQHVRPSEIQKFERDLLQNSNNAKANAGLFVSLKTETIPGKGTLYFEFFNNVPVVYVSNVYENMNNLKIAMEILYNIQQTLGTSDTISETAHDIVYIQDTVNDFVQIMFQKQKSHVQNIQKMKSAYDALGQSIITEEKMVNESLNVIDTLKQSLDWVIYNDAVVQNTSSSVQKSQRKQDAINFFIDFYNKNQKWPTTSEIPDYKASVYRGDMSISNLKTEAQKLLNL